MIVGAPEFMKVYKVINYQKSFFLLFFFIFIFILVGSEYTAIMKNLQIFK